MADSVLHERLNAIQGSVSSLDHEQKEIKEVLIKNTQILEYHVKRTDTLEDKLDPIYHNHIFKKELIARLKTFSVLVGIMAALAGVITGVIMVIPKK